MITNAISLRPGVRVRPDTDGSIRVFSPFGGVRLGEHSRSVLDRLAAGPCDLVELLTPDVTGAHALLCKLGARGFLRTTMHHDGRPLLSFPGSPTGCATQGPLVLSRFALVRREDDRLVLESSRTGVVVEVHDTALLAVLAEPARHPWAAPVVEALAAQGFLVPEEAEHDDFDLAKWSPHELWFHTRSQAGDDGRPWGGTRWAEGRFEPLPAHRPEFQGPVVELSEPGVPEVPVVGRTVRAQDHANPMTLDQLSEFLHRTVRIRRVWTDGVADLVERPFPSGGALHELEVYPVVTAVRGLHPGLYHYDSARHVLHLVREDGPLVRRLADRATRAANLDRTSQVLLVISARFGRVMWKYQSMAYALSLKNTGVLTAAMYAVATAMGLAPCAVGGSDSGLFARATGLDATKESTVGEFVLGSAPVGVEPRERRGSREVSEKGAR